jgi:Dpy-30 motif
MDALYLKNNVYTALTEALASMAVALPDDKVEYLGKYLLKYVDRKKIKEEVDLSLQDILLREEAETLNNSMAQV